MKHKSDAEVLAILKRIALEESHSSVEKLCAAATFETGFGQSTLERKVKNNRWFQELNIKQQGIGRKAPLKIGNGHYSFADVHRMMTV